MNSEGFFLTPGGDTFVQKFLPYKKLPSKIFQEHAKISTFSPKNDVERFFFRPLVVTHLFKIHFPTKNSLAKFFLKIHRFRLIH